MNKNTLLALVLMLSTSAPIMATDIAEMACVASVEQSQVELVVKGRMVNVVNGQGMTLHVYDITGAEVVSIRIDGANKSYNLDLKRGCYLVKVGDVTRKISVL